MRGRTIIELHNNLLDHDALAGEGFTIHSVGPHAAPKLARSQAA
jgi:hypothetical protein